jgi:Tfp pilus assembly protein PilP
MRILFLILICVFASNATAACVRYQPPANITPGFDGPGSFGELQDTVTLDCLKYVGSIFQNGKEFVLIKDERGEVHSMSIGSYMGQNSGVITNIDHSAIYIKQMIQRNGVWKDVVVKFNKSIEP